MRILHVLPSLSPEWGGPVSLLRLLLPALSRRGIESEIISSQGIRTGSPVPIEGFKNHAFETTFLARFWTGFSSDIKRAINEKVQEVDAVHIHELWHYPHYAAARACQANRIPYVVTPHGALEPWAYEHKGFKKRLYMSAYQRKYLANAGMVQALTEAESSQVTSVEKHALTRVIPNGLELSVIDAQSATPLSPEIQRFLSNHRTITFLGRMHRKKGIEPLFEGFLKASKNSPELALLFVGPDDDGYTSWINSRASDAGLSDRTMVAGPVSGAERFEILRRSWTFALTSYSEGFSMAVLEALACSTPVIISPACYFPEAIQAGAGIITEPVGDNVANAIEELGHDHARRIEMGSAGRRLIEDNYTIDRMAQLIGEMYEDAKKNTAN